MLPYASAGGYGGGPYGRRKGFLSSQNTVVGVLTVVAIAALGFSVFTHFRASSAYAQKAAVQNELESVRSDLHSIKSQFSSRNAEHEQLQVTYGHTQRRITELTSQLQRKEADLVSKEQALQQHIKERGVMDQHRSGREAELSKMVEDLRAELIRSDGVIEALDSKVAQMESTHTTREKDWHILANKWIKYEQDLHDQYKKCTDEVSKLRNITATMNDTQPIPEAEPQLRPETDFGHIRTEVPVHKPHHFEPLAPPTPQAQPTDLPLPEPKIRDSVLAMTGGQVGGGQQAGQGQGQEPGHGQQPPAGGSTAPEPTQVHHHDVYHHDFHQEDEGAHLHNYDHYHGHYDSYDPMDEWWLHDAHGDWNADEHGAGHGGDQVHGHGHDNYHNYHHQQAGDNHHDQGHHHQQQQPEHDHHAQQRRQHLQEAAGGGWGQPPQDAHHYHHPQPPAMQGMDPHAHAQHAPSHWQPPDPHQHHQEQYQQHQQHYQDPQYQQHQHQQHGEAHNHYQQHGEAHNHQQQHGEAHNHHQQPRGDLAYKMGW